MFDDMPVHLIVALGGFAVGFAYGALAWRTQFCVVGSLYSSVAADDHRGTRAVYLAMAAAIVFTQAVVSVTGIDVDQSIYRTATMHWAGATAGGLAFGYGMVKANGCGSGSLVNLGGGDLRSLIVLMFMGLFAYMTLNGLTAVPRAALERAADLDLATRGFASQGLDDLLAGFGLGKAESLRWPIALVAAAAIAAIVFRHGPFRRSPVHIVSGIGIGAVIAAGWYMTGRIGADAFDAAPIESLTFVTPIGDTILYAVTYTGSTVNFGIGAVLGVVVGSTLVARLRGEFRLQYPDGDRDLIDAIFGGALMGIGGVFAFGCTVGNGLSGVSVLSVGSALAWAAIMIGGYQAANRKFRVAD